MKTLVIKYDLIYSTIFFFSLFLHRITYAHLKAGDAMFKVVRVNDSSLLASTIVKNVRRYTLLKIIFLLSRQIYLCCMLTFKIYMHVYNWSE